MGRYTEIFLAANEFCKLAAKLNMNVQPGSVREHVFVNDKGREEFSTHQLTPQDLSEAKQFLIHYLERANPMNLAAASNRYSFQFLGISPNTYYHEPVFNFKVKPRGSKSGEPSMGGFFKNKTIVKYKSPSQAIADIPSTGGLAYRGMSYEEYAQILQRGFVQSKGEYNLGEAQIGYTYFAPDTGGAKFYASSFTPWRFKPSHNKPGVVIGVNASLLQTHQDSPKAIPEGELATRNPIPIDEVKEIYFIIPVEIEEGTLSLRKTKSKDGFTIAEQDFRNPDIREYSTFRIK